MLTCTGRMHDWESDLCACALLADSVPVCANFGHRRTGSWQRRTFSTLTTHEPFSVCFRLFLASSQNVPSWLSTERAAVASGMKEVQRPALPDEGWQLVEGLASARDGNAEQDCVAP
eukprot:6208677-Pleurochrysis_carterae.AAC.4